MKINDIITQSKPSLSFEVFPPKTSDKYETVSTAVKEIAMLSPSYISVTYGAGGGTSIYTTNIAAEIAQYGITPLAHLSCISSTKEQIKIQLDKLDSLGIKNILALRGDIPHDRIIDNLEYRYASELVRDINKYGSFCIGGACYPECHPESQSMQSDLENLKIKVDCGCEYLTTQMFFDNDVFYRFVERASSVGINVPIVAGIMPITSYSQIARIVDLSGNALPADLRSILDKYKDDQLSLRQAGLEYASKQAREIYESGYNAIHIYTMNKPDVAKEIQINLWDIIK